MSRRSLLLILRLGVSVVALAVLLPRVAHSWSHVVRWRPTTVGWLVAGTVVTFVGVVLSAVRWQRVLAAFELPARLRALLGHYLAGLFVGNALPTSIGGDVLRVVRLSAENDDRPSTFASVVLERMTGWIVLPVIALFGLSVNPGLRHLGTATRVAVGFSVGTLGLLVLVVVAAGSPQLGGRLAHRESWLRFVGAVHVGLERFRRRPATAAAAILAGFAYQLVVVLSVYFASRALGIAAGITALLAFVPVVAIIQVLPISIGGLGVRESAFALFLHPLGVSTAQAVTLGLLMGGMTLVVSLLGAPAFAVGTRSARPARVVA